MFLLIASVFLIFACDNLRMAKPKKKPQQWKPTKLRAWREWREMDLEDLAHAMPYNVGSLSQIETGKARYNQDVMEMAARVLRVPASFLIDRNPPPKGTDLDYLDMRMIEHLMANADADQQKKISDFFRNLETGKFD